LEYATGHFLEKLKLKVDIFKKIEKRKIAIGVIKGHGFIQFFLIAK
jgi:hypothetical protein